MKKMASCRFEGLDELIEQMERYSGNIEEVFDEMTIKGAEVCAEAWKETADKYHHKDSGDMIKSINYDRKIKKIGELKTSSIYPRGNQTKTTGQTRAGKKSYLRGKPVRRAAIAFMRHYGTSARAGTYFVDEADKLTNEKAPQILFKRWNEFLERGK